MAPDTTASAEINVGHQLLEMNKNLGAIAQLAATTSDGVTEIRTNQKTTDRTLANLDFKIDDLNKEFTRLSSDHSALTQRVTAIEKKDTERTSFFKGNLAVLSLVWAILIGFLFNIDHVISVYNLVWGKNEPEISEVDPGFGQQ